MKTKGFTIIELIIAVAIGAFLIAAYLGYWGSSTRAVESTKDYLTAILLAQEAIEACRSYPFDWLDKDVDFSLPPYSNYNSISERNFLEYDLNSDDGPDDKFWHTKIIGKIKYTRDVNIENVPAKDGSDMKLKFITVTVRYNSISTKKEVKYTVKTCITQFKI